LLALMPQVEETIVLDIAIVGGGLGGLTAALRLHQAGFRPRVYESVRELKELGVGIVVQPYGIKEIAELGLLGELRKVSVESRESFYFNQYGQQIYFEHCGRFKGYPHEQRFVHRGIMQMLLYDAVVQRLGKDAIVLGARCTGFTEDQKGVTVRFRSNNALNTVPEEVRADILIGADGIKSAIRDQLYPQDTKPHYSGISMWRGVSLMPRYNNGGTILHIGAPSYGSLIVYPILDNAYGTDLTLTNWVVEQNGRPESIEDWYQKADVAEIAHMFDICKIDFIDVGEMIRAAKDVWVYPLIDHDPLPRWSYGRVTLMGDAAHALYPRGGHGACQAFVDAGALARNLASVVDPIQGLKNYEEERRDRVNRLLIANRGDGPEVIRRIVEERTGSKPFDDIEKVLPFAEADAIIGEYHRLAGMKSPTAKTEEVKEDISALFLKQRC
jgi:2-polyprenyl-6-methoxyphenol hydroxylase-like FAD-dependent oxidoreductase